MYWCAHKTANLTSFQCTVQGRNKDIIGSKIVNRKSTTENYTIFYISDLPTISEWSIASPVHPVPMPLAEIF